MSSRLSRATTIATRYGVVRKQFSMRPHVPEGGIGSGADPDSGVETSILDYPLFQRRIIPLLSQAYVGQRCRVAACGSVVIPSPLPLLSTMCGLQVRAVLHWEVHDRPLLLVPVGEHCRAVSCACR